MITWAERRCVLESEGRVILVTLRSVRASQTYGPIRGRGCLLDEPASQWEAFIYIHTFATHLPISMCPTAEGMSIFT